MRAAVTGGAGFVGSHLCERLIAEGWHVLCLDSLLTGDLANLDGLRDEPRFAFEQQDVTLEVDVPGELDWVFHLASPASPNDYLRHPIRTLEVGSLGTRTLLELGREKGASFLLASTSEVYGNPRVHPQPESYAGNVNPVGPRSVYDEAKRFAEAITTAYHRVHGTSIRIARIFNTYGERMRPDDGRAVPTFVRQALAGDDLTVFGDGSQTRSLCYVSDLVEGLWRLAGSELERPVNLGNPEEVTIEELARRIARLVGSGASVVHVERPEDDPDLRRPDLALARSALGWEPTVSLDEGLARFVAWARSAWAAMRAADSRR
jgi:dTDP-glucose 4,6-dehydratase